MDRKFEQKGECRGNGIEKEVIKLQGSRNAAAVTSQAAWKGFPHYYLSFSPQGVSSDRKPIY